MAPKLVKLYDTHQFYDISGGKRAVAREELADAVVDLLRSEISPREGELVADILIGLIRQAETDLKKALSQRLSSLDRVPLRVVLHLANEPIEIAQPVLEHSPILSDMDLIYLVNAQGPQHWQAIARRSRIGAALIDVLADTCDPVTGRNLVENKEIKLTPHAFGVLGTLSEKSHGLAEPLLARDDLPQEIAMRLYRNVGAALRTQIVSRFKLDPETLGQIDDVLREFSGKHSAFTPTGDMIAAAESAKRKGVLTIPAILETIGRGQIASFIAQISVFGEISPRATESILHRSGGTHLAGLCRALGIDKADFTRIFLMTQRLRDPSGIATQKSLSRALSAYDRSRGMDTEKFLAACRREFP